MTTPNVYDLIFCPKSFHWGESPCSLKMMTYVEDAFAYCDGKHDRPDAIDVIDFLYDVCEMSPAAATYFAGMLSTDRAKVLLDIQPFNVSDVEYSDWIRDVIAFYDERGAFD